MESDGLTCTAILEPTVDGTSIEGSAPSESVDPALWEQVTSCLLAGDE